MLRSFVLTFFTVVILALSASAQLPVTTVVFAKGSPVPGAGDLQSGVPAGATFLSFGGYVDDGAGHSAFLGTWKSSQGKGKGIFHNGVPVAVVNGPAPTGSPDGAKFATLGHPLLSETGVAFPATLKGARVSPRLLKSVWSNALEGQLRPYLFGAAPPEIPGGVIASVTSFSLRGSELLALVKLKVGAGPVTAATQTALLVKSPTRYQLLLRTGVRDIYQGVLASIKKLSAFTPAPLSPGHGRSHVEGAAAVQLTMDDKRILSAAVYSSTDLRSVATLGSSSTYTDVGLPGVGSGSGAIVAVKRAHLGQIRDANDQLILAGDSSMPLNAVVVESDPAVGAFKIGSFADPIMNLDGAFAFSAQLAGINLSATNNRALFFAPGAAAVVVARLGDYAPDITGEALEDLRYGSFVALGLPDGAEAGPLWIAKLVGPTATKRKNLALFARDSQGVRRRLLRTGDPIQVNGTSKDVLNFTALAGGGYPVGARRAYGQAGTVPVLVTFTDLSTALVKITYQ